jgi:rare lipoprotein A
MKKQQKNSNLFKSVSLTGYLSLLLCIVLSGCSSLDDGTPIIEKHAKRGYNKPYEINGTTYHPQKSYEYAEEGKASHYGLKDGCHGRKTSTGQKFNAHALTAAHKTLPIPSMVRVTNLDNGRTINLKIVDRGPFVKGRIIDVSSKAAKMLGFYDKGICNVRVESLVDESIHFAQNYNPNKPSPSVRFKEKVVAPVKEITQPTTLLAEKAVESIPESSPIKLVSYQVPMNADAKAPQIHRLRSPAEKKDAVNGVFVDMGMYANADKAQKLVRLTNSKFRVPVKSYRLKKNKQQFYRVLVGPFNNSENASNLLAQIHSHGYRSAVVVYE